MANVLNVGIKVDLRVIKHEQTSIGIQRNYRTYKSKILDIQDDNKLKLAMPIEGGTVILFPLEQVFEVFFYTTNGLYQAKGKVVDKIKENNIFILVLELTSKVEKNQRREYFRYESIIDVKYTVISEYESSLILEEEIEEAREKKIEWKKGVIVDISGGGIRFTSDENFHKDSNLLCKFTLIINSKAKEFSTIIKMISSEKIIDRVGQYENRAKYISMSPEDSEQVVRYIFIEERKSRKNRKS